MSPRTNDGGKSRARARRASAQADRHALSPEMTDALKIGASTFHGRIYLPIDARKNAPLCMQLASAGLAYWGGASGCELMIRPAGRAAVNGPSMDDLLEQEMRAHSYEGLS